MKKTFITLIVANGISLLIAILNGNRVLSFTDSLGFMSIFALLISGFIFLEQFGYFDVFGYSFRKTYLVLMKKYNDLDETDKARYRDMFAYRSFKEERRAKPSFSFYLFTLLIFLEAILFVYIYSIL